jgi:large subunit ribosomal protein L23
MKYIISPVLTEKSAAQIDAGLYVFTVTKEANKVSIAKEINELYKTEPISVRIVNLPAKAVVFKRKKGMRSVRRKAYVQLPPKATIPGFETLKENKEAAEKAAEKEAKDAAKEAKTAEKEALKETK